MSSHVLTPEQDREVTFLSGVGADGVLASQSFWTWNQDNPATYGATDYETKYGARIAGQGSGIITFSFDPASGWTAQEEAAFKTGMALWSAVADVHFQEVGSSANFTIARGSDGAAEAGTTRLQPGQVGGTTLGHPVEASLSIDTGKAGFGPIGAALDVYGGYPWLTLEHELGHILGLGHTGPYDEGVTPGAAISYGSLDTRQFSIMSYNDVSWGHRDASGAFVHDYPLTPQLLDIVALQRIYGTPTDTPLSGGQVFGFNSNIVGPIAPIFDFTQDTHPVVTLWDAGGGNTLDLSGFASGANVDLNPGAVSSVGGLSNNLVIALGTHIDSAIGGAGADTLSANVDGDLLVGGAGADMLRGGAGSDLIFGGSGADVINSGDAGADTLFGGQGGDYLGGHGFLSGDIGDDQIEGDGPQDTLMGGDGNDSVSGLGQSWLFGNKGDDTLLGSGAVSLFGGQGDDHLSAGTTGGMIFGNLGNDAITASGSTSVYGGQGDDRIDGRGNTGLYISGDLGADTIVGGDGADTIIGGQGADMLTGDYFDSDPYGHAALPTGPINGHAGDLFVYRALSDSTPDAPDRITDFNQFEDRVDLTAIDAARVAAGATPFHLVDAFDGQAGEAALGRDASGSNTLLMLDADGDGRADFVLVVSGVDTSANWIVF